MNFSYRSSAGHGEVIHHDLIRVPALDVLRDAAHAHASGSLAWILSENTGDVELRTFFVEPFTDHSRREQRELTQSRISIASEIKEFNDSLHAQIVQRQIGLNI